jgi:hypothetical protein
MDFFSELNGVASWERTACPPRAGALACWFRRLAETNFHRARWIANPKTYKVRDEEGVTARTRRRTLRSPELEK